LPNPLPQQLSWKPELLAALSAADRALGELAGMLRSLPGPDLLSRLFISREAVLSSRIEGIQASLSDLYVSEAFQLPFLDQVSRVNEVRNYIRALVYGLKRLQTSALDLPLIAEFHTLLMEDVRRERLSSGQSRSDERSAGSPGSSMESADYFPQSGSEMYEALQDFEQYLQSPADTPPLIRLGLIHYQFEAIHPFADSSGRLGRLLVSLLLHAWDLLPQPMLYMSAYLETHKRLYYESLLGVSQKGLWEDWLVYFLGGIKTQAIDAAQRIRHLLDLREQYRARFHTARAAGRLLEIIDLLFEQPILTIQQVSTALGVQSPAARQYVEQLKQAGILREITGHARSRLYQADEILYTIEGSLLGE
jgi:Fic family protein